MSKWNLIEQNFTREFINSLEDNGIIPFIINSKIQSNFPVNIKCTKCGSIFSKQLKFIMDNSGKLYPKALLCGKCSRYGDKQWHLKLIDFQKEFVDGVTEDVLLDIVHTESGQSNYPVTIKCPKCGKVRTNKLNNLMDKTGKLYHPKTFMYCNSCSLSRYAKSEEFKEKRIEISTKPENRNTLTNYVKEHPECIKDYRRSHFELEIESYVQSLGLETKHDRTILEGRELDIYILSKKIAIECNGLYWHTYPKKDYTYHYDKFIECKNKGIHLIQITDQDWYDKKDKIKMYLHDLLVTDKKAYYARKLQIKPVYPSIAKEFYKQYHLQGCKVYYPINYGLYCNEELISCMSFGKSRVLNRSNKEGYYELHRYCVRSDCTVVGGAEKLFKHFIIDYNPVEIKSFSDNDYFSGGIYERLGFINTENIRVYYWINLTTGDYRDREKCQLKYLKDLFPESYNEANKLKETNEIGNREVFIMENEGYEIYVTAGRTKWVYHRKE